MCGLDGVIVLSAFINFSVIGIAPKHLKVLKSINTKSSFLQGARSNTPRNININEYPTHKHLTALHKFLVT